MYRKIKLKNKVIIQCDFCRKKKLYKSYSHPTQPKWYYKTKILLKKTKTRFETKSLTFYLFVNFLCNDWFI